MIGVEAAVLYRTMGYLPVALLALCVAGVGCFPSLQLDWHYRKKFFSALAIVTCYWLWWRFDLRLVQPSRSAQFAENFALAASLGLMMLQALQYYWKDARGLPNYYPLLGALSLAFASDHYITNSSERPLIFGLVMGFGVLLILYYGTETRPPEHLKKTYRGYRAVLLACCFTLSMLLAAGTVWVLGNSEQAVGQWIANRSFAQNRFVLGNQLTARMDSMSSIKGKNFDHIALQIVADESPGYLRGQVYDTYNNKAWSAVGVGDAADNPEDYPVNYTPEWSDESLYVVAPAADSVVGEMVVYPDERIDRAMFTPGETGWVGSQFGYLIVNEARVVQASSELLGRPYHVLTTVEPAIEALSPEEFAQYTVLPSNLAPQLKELAAQVAGDQTSVLGKANAITQYFTSNYDYVLGIEVPTGEEPMAYFLFSDPLPDGHCEFFATGAALLLRASGVPARYVTGVGVWEQHPFADYWVARNRDAHAWVEAWDPEEGWFIVEATPASGLPTGAMAQSTGGFRDFWSMLSLTVRRLIAAVKEGAWTSLTHVLRTVLWGVLAFLQWAWWLVVAVGIVALLLWEIRKRWRKGGWRKGPIRDEMQQQLQEQISGMDRWVYKKLRLRRAPHTTAHAFARELEASPDHQEKQRSLAQWYRQWATLRYRSAPKPEEVEALEATRKALQAQGPPRGKRDTYPG